MYRKCRFKEELFHKTNFCRKVNKNSIPLRFHVKKYAKWRKRGFSNSHLLKLKQVRHQLKFLSLLRSLVPANGWEPISFKHPRKSQKILNLEYFPIQKPFLTNNSKFYKHDIQLSVLSFNFQRCKTPIFSFSCRFNDVSNIGPTILLVLKPF